ncbi:hypothetical protein [Burkholderia lata]|uniref:Uncharacterized protein n=1 Tax=Burkholderia lata (strain ATCC 17760 / DSM 23089 / LMG 22485 / NCIMB 9086 / R18194 / 383) TaxID=482957 RepID=A0A6P2STD2_BURL3|nr:hypothetical protein [Burkholderia lata]VWC52885.1 hypothetical protein BLA18109_00347 [Burkholderia lata]
MLTTGAAIPASRRYTTIRVIAYHGILQNITSLLQFVPFVLFVLHERSLNAFSAWSWQFRVLQGALLVSAIAGLVSHVALALRRRWGRTVALATWGVSCVVWLLLSTWVPVLVGLPFGIIGFALMYNRHSGDYLSLPQATSGSTVRRVVSFGLLAAASALYYWAISYAAVHSGAFAYIIPNIRPKNLLQAAAVLLVLGTAVAPRGRRMWSCGMSLMTAAIAMLSMLAAYVPIATPLVRHMPQEYQRTAVAIPWQPIMVYVVVTFCVALVLIRVTKSPTRSGWEQGANPDAPADSARRETTS